MLKNLWLKIIEIIKGLYVQPPKLESPSDQKLDDPSWIKVAKLELGTKELPGDENNPRILEYHKATSLKATTDEVPWCASFITWCLEHAGYKSTKSAASLSYLTYGTPLLKPQYGCVVVFYRGLNKGHIGFFVGDEKEIESGDFLTVLGGNQGNEVKISKFPRSIVLSYRWPEY